MPKRMNSKIVKQRRALVNPQPVPRLANPGRGRAVQGKHKILLLVKGRGKYEGGIIQMKIFLDAGSVFSVESPAEQPGQLHGTGRAR